jgi:hypothetical protein
MEDCHRESPELNRDWSLELQLPLASLLLRALPIADQPDQRRDFTTRKQILWESVTATQDEVNRMGREFITELRANDPTIGYNRLPKWKPPLQ